MRFLVDECTGPKVAAWLRNQTHEVFSVFEQARGMSDDDVLQKAHQENWILVTNDKDFGEKIFRQRQPHSGVVLLRLADERPESKIAVMSKLLQDYSDQLANAFVVVTSHQVRFGRV